MCTACAPHAHSMRTACTPHARGVHAACTPHAQAYAPGTAACAALVAAFGAEIVGEGGAVDRRALGAKVFEDKAAMARLCEIVWPATAALAVACIAAAEGSALVVMEAAVLLEAGWAAAPCIGGCIHMNRIGGCNPMHRRLQPCAVVGYNVTHGRLQCCVYEGAAPITAQVGADVR